jgi:hypothetical protein
LSTVRGAGDLSNHHLSQCGGELLIKHLMPVLIAIRGIPSQHADGNGFSVKSNADYIIDIGGLRIVHFGDLGQTSLLPMPLAAIGPVDVAIM